jgi:hypothetical protein
MLGLTDEAVDLMMRGQVKRAKQEVAAAVLASRWWCSRRARLYCPHARAHVEHGFAAMAQPALYFRLKLKSCCCGKCFTASSETIHASFLLFIHTISCGPRCAVAAVLGGVVGVGKLVMAPLNPP